MTYIVTNNKVVIADRHLEQTIGMQMLGRVKPDADGFHSTKKDAPGVKVAYRDCNKIIPLRNGFHKGNRLTHLMVSGEISHMPELVRFLNNGGDIDLYIDVQLTVPQAQRRNYHGKATICGKYENGDTMITQGIAGGCSVRRSAGIIHSGSGSEAVDGINMHVPGGLTPLECFVVASHYTASVSEEFDYLNIATGKITYNQKLTTRQRQAILDSIQSRFKLDGEVIVSPRYIN